MNYNNFYNGSNAIGNGEVDSSILSGSTSPLNEITGSRKTNWPFGEMLWHFSAKSPRHSEVQRCFRASAS
jgi:hypothetical protein